MRWMPCSLLVASAVSVGLAGAWPGHAGNVSPSLPTAVRMDPPLRSFSVAAVGDWLSEGLVNRVAAGLASDGVRYDHEPLLRPVAPLLQSVDLAICHMETPIGLPGAKAGLVGTSPSGTSLIAAPYEVAGDLARAGFDRCSTASNHSNDLGATGIIQTLDALDEVGISHTGTARSPEESGVDVFEVSGVEVAHVSYALNSNTGWPSDSWRLDKAVNATEVVNDVVAARSAGAEVVIVSLHVYVEMQSGPTVADRALVQAVTSRADVDLVVIHGPHVVQPFEWVNATPVYWSLGNFMSAMGLPDRGRYSDTRTLDGLMATVRFTEQADGSWSAEPFTVLLCNVTGSHKVYPGLTTLADPAISSVLRAQLQACVGRTLPVVAEVH